MGNYRYLAELQQDFWEELIGHDALSGQSIANPLDEVGRRRPQRDLRF
jgi:hypothetical protein